jgi:hypothetical protein
MRPAFGTGIKSVSEAVESKASLRNFHPWHGVRN